MTLHCYYVNPGEREWPTWLEFPGTRPVPTTADFASKAYYEGDAVFLVLIHLGRGLFPTDVSDHLTQWNDLANPKVYWLFYGGISYQERSPIQNIHYLRYAIEDSPDLRSDAVARFKSLVSALHVDPVRTTNVWDSLYPAENIELATLLALLSAGDHVDIDGAMERVVRERIELERAHEQYSSRLTGGERVLALEEWVKDFQGGSYARVRSELVRVLGAVPD